MALRFRSLNVDARIRHAVTSIGHTIPLRFGLRSLVLLITIVSLLLWVGASARSQRLAISEIERLGGYVVYDYELSQGPEDDPLINFTWDEPMDAWPSSKREPTVDLYRSVNLVSFVDPFDERNTAVDDSVIDVILGFSRLRYLDMSHTSITDRGFLRLVDLEDLKTVDISGNNVSEAARIRFKNERPSVEIRF